MKTSGDKSRPDPVAWVTGAAGLIGNYLVQAAAARRLPWTVRPLTRRDLDLTDARAVERAFAADRPVVVIHCAALSQSPACQADPALARRLNVDATARLAELTEAGAFYFFSTDLVFDGAQGFYDESARVNPQSVYGETKAEAERLVLVNPRHAVIRTSLNGGTSISGERGFNEQMRRAWGRGEVLRLFRDEYRSPISAAVTARAVWELAIRRATGIYHVAGTERLSRLQIGELLAARWSALDPRIEPASLSEYRGAPRPPDTSLRCDKAQSLLSFKLCGLSEWLAANPDEEF